MREEGRGGLDYKGSPLEGEFWEVFPGQRGYDWAVRNGFVKDGRAYIGEF